ncbi:PstS family phosphate ABC transporter substrate-binding protein [Allonocardiopsis opalescens]|uniref:Phosphate-binding protein n=1 Tax=Allonocardiopsis opalescens TaxID=1144618 RepID=A0A2T0Q522_9ACTN|nr:PstS family phosphate ABC transporter substrate-binding protein [Allonocardiopsis opalescens]PRX98935.1 phosphate ABC transporter substrate-binding protein (PhoT family) [Allonocardiopsis opalescens]
MAIGKRGLVWVAGASALAAVLAGCGGNAEQAAGGGEGALSGTVTLDGSSTVAPLSTAAAELFQAENPGVQVTVGTSGTGGGFERFCAGETDISNASRPIGEDEVAVCEDAGVVYQEFQVANDALTVVVNTENDWASCLTVEQLNAIWEPDSEVTNWNQVDPSFPDEPLELFGAGTDSGTFDYFTEVINGEEGATRTDYSPSEDDNVTVQGVTGSPGGMGYFGFSYFEENADQLRAVEIDNGEGCVAPSVETVQVGSYTPLGRPLFIYPTAEVLARPEGLAFVEFYVANHAEIAEAALFIPLNAEQEADLQADLDALREQAGA